MNTSRKGNGKELASAAILQADGWVVGSRRHVAGPGDLLAVKLGHRPRLIEVKATAGGPYERFGRKDREELVRCAAAAGADPFLAYWAPAARVHRLIGPDEWPPLRRT